MEITSSTPPVAIPSLRGQLLIEGSTHVCRGVWALSDSAHHQPGQTSDFEFRLLKPNDGCNGYPQSGRYQGWFYLKTLKGQVKIEDKEINIRFIAVVGEEGCHRVEGEGVNKFGKFKVYGSLSGNGYLQMYREYLPKESTGFKRKSNAISTGAKPSPVKESNRGGPRVRKAASLGSSFVSGDRPQSKASAPSVASSEGGARTQRLSNHMLKCSEILKDLSRQSHAVWFNQPVDYVALKIPDYPTIIKEPMDFSTIQRNLDNHFYKSPEAFSEHVRLVFKNAITYNTMRDNPVHIAARELSNRFEDRYRQLMSQLTAQGYGQVTGEGSFGRGAGGGGMRRVKSRGGIKRTTSYGPGQIQLPLAMDGGLLELQRKMLEMQNEISNLRAQVKQNEVKSELELHMYATLPSLGSAVNAITAKIRTTLSLWRRRRRSLPRSTSFLLHKWTR